MTSTPAGAPAPWHAVITRALSSCTRSTTAARMPMSASGRTPCPRLKMWPVPLPSAAPSAITWRAAASTTGQGHTHRAGSRLPWTAWSGPTRVAGRVEGHPPVHADHVGAGRGHQAEQLAGAHAEEDGRHAEVGDPFEHRPGGGQDEAAVLVGGERTRPSCRRAGRPGRRPRSGPAGRPPTWRPGGPSAGPTGRGRRA